MALNFMFNFEGDSIHPDDEETDGTAIECADQRDEQSSISMPQKHSLEGMLSTLPSSISYNTYSATVRRPTRSRTTKYGSTPLTEPSHLQNHQATSITIWRRSLFDVVTQLKAEADIDDQFAEGVGSDPCTAISLTSHSNKDGYDALVASLEGRGATDLRPGIYEGGFKTWECSVDLAKFVATESAEGKFDHWLNSGSDQGFRVIELGAGSAMPSLVILSNVLNGTWRNKEKTQGLAKKPFDGKRKLRFVLCDYNVEVLRMVTAANVLLQLCKSESLWTSDISEKFEERNAEDEGELDDITPEFYRTALQTLQDSCVKIEFVSGTWGDEFVDSISPLFQKVNHQSEMSHIPSQPTLILASETIYSLASLISFTRTVLTLLRRSSTDSRALVAAKKIYFGVGGGIDAFTSEVRSQGGCVETVCDITDDRGGGVGRAILQVTIASLEV